MSDPRIRLVAAVGYVMGTLWGIVCIALGFGWPTVLIGATCSGVIAATARPLREPR